MGLGLEIYDMLQILQEHVDGIIHALPNKLRFANTKRIIQLSPCCLALALTKEIKIDEVQAAEADTQT